MINAYEPREDSTMLEAYVRQYAKGSVLDIGTGSGIQAIAAAENKKVKRVIATDIQESIIRFNKKNIKNKKIKFLASDLFENIENKKFDTIIFNPPYLPQELKLKDLTLEGGKKGYEVVEMFLNQANNFLKANGIILIIFSSLTKKEKVDEFIKNNLFEFELLEKQHIFFEDLYAYLIKKSAVLKTLEKKKIKNIKYFANGKRGMIFAGNYDNKKTAIKIKNPESEAVLRINNEINFLKILNRKNIGPKLLFYDKDFLAYEFVEGINILDFFASLNNNSINKPNNKINNLKNKKIISGLIKKIMSQMHIMDKLKINKEEMSHPQKHILIDKKNKPVLIDAQKSKISGISKIVPILIDFERTHYTIKPSNVTQFCDFLISKHMAAMLKNINIKINNKKIINAAKKYKKLQNTENFNRIIKLISD